MYDALYTDNADSPEIKHVQTNEIPLPYIIESMGNFYLASYKNLETDETTIFNDALKLA